MKLGFFSRMFYEISLRRERRRQWKESNKLAKKRQKREKVDPDK